MPAIGQERWEAVRKRYEGGAPVATLCREYGISRAAFYRRRAREGWERGAAHANTQPQAANPGGPPLSIDTDSSIIDSCRSDLSSSLACRQDGGKAGEGVGPDPLEAELARLAALQPRTLRRHQGLLRQAQKITRELARDGADGLVGASKSSPASALGALVGALERLIKLERQLVGLSADPANDGGGGGVTVAPVIVVPGKVDGGDWHEAAMEQVEAAAKRRPVAIPAKAGGGPGEGEA